PMAEKSAVRGYYRETAQRDKDSKQQTVGARTQGANIPGYPKRNTMFCATVFGRRYRCVLFFFSSRRRHTRLQGDWSSDVCSSDLGPDGRQRPFQFLLAGI